MTTHTLKINEFDVSCRPVQYTCHGLGSCVGVFITDRTKGLSSGAHIQMPFSCPQGEIPDACQLIEQMLTGLSMKGSDLKSLRAKITGGAQIYTATLNIGQLNVSVVTEMLVNNKIYIASKDVGGFVSRTARFISTTGELHITTSEQINYSI